MFTSGTTGNPKGVILTHANVLAGSMSFHGIINPMEHRIVSLLPCRTRSSRPSRCTTRSTSGADVLYVRSRNPRVIFDSLREHRVTSMVLVPQVLDLFWSAIEREVEKQGRTATFNRLRGIARRMPYAVRRLLFRSVHTQFGGGLRLFATAGAFLPPALQQAWEDMGVIVIQGYGATETFAGAATTMNDHPLGCVGWPPKPVEMRIVEDGEIQFRGPSLSPGYWEDPEATAAAFTEDGWYKSGDLGAFDDKGRLLLHGRKKDIIVLPNGFNVFPEDLENALRVAGIRDSVAIETKPGRIEAVVLPPGRTRFRATRGRRRRSRARSPRTSGARSTPRSRPPTVARAQPADRRLARLARGGLPAHPHVQGQARPGAGVGRDQRAAAGGRRGLRLGGRAGPLVRDGQEGGDRLPDRRQRRGEAGHLGVGRDQRRVREEHERRADATDDELRRRAGTGPRRCPRRGRTTKSLPTWSASPFDGSS